MIPGYQFLYRLLMPRRYRHYLQLAGGDVDKCHETLLHGTYYEEYVAYDFAHKGEKERRSYITDAYRNKVCRRINDPSQQALTMDKYRTAQHFANFYRRAFMLASSPTDREIFVDFCQRYGEVVVKPIDDCAGRGVELLQSQDWNMEFDRLIQNRRSYIVEERIHQAAEMARWNDSVNTIRINTFQHDGKVRFFTSFLRTGRKGSFVDNGAQGGLFASIDTANGTIFTDGYDELRRKYSHHPDSHKPYKGVIIPRWDELLQKAEEMALMLPKMTYIGWDMALTAEGWVLVEANKGEFIAQQITQGRGLRQEFEAVISSLTHISIT